MTSTSWEEVTLPASPSVEDSLRLLARMLVSASHDVAISGDCRLAGQVEKGLDVVPDAKVVSDVR